MLQVYNFKKLSRLNMDGKIILIMHFFLNFQIAIWTSNFFYLVNDRGLLDKAKKEEFELLCKVNTALEEGKHVRFLDWNEKEIFYLNKYLFLTAKPMIYLLNMSKKDYVKKKNKWLMPIKQKVWKEIHFFFIYFLEKQVSGIPEYLDI